MNQLRKHRTRFARPSHVFASLFVTRLQLLAAELSNKMVRAVFYNQNRLKVSLNHLQTKELILTRAGVRCKLALASCSSWQNYAKIAMTLPGNQAVVMAFFA